MLLVLLRLPLVNARLFFSRTTLAQDSLLD
jgi:hypothetical protein